MLVPVAYGLAVVLVLFVVFIGARFLGAPQAAAAGYGVPAKPDGDTAYLEIKGLRDLTLGLVGLALIVFAAPTPPPGTCWSRPSRRSATPSSCCATAAPGRSPSASTSRPP